MGKYKESIDVQPDVIPLRTVGKIRKYQATLGNLQGLTDEKCAAGDKAYAMNLLGVPEHGRDLTCLLASPPGSNWGEFTRRTLNPSVATPSTAATLLFLSFGSTTQVTPITQIGAYWMALYPTKVIRMQIFIENDPGATALSVHQNLNAVALETVSQVLPAATTLQYDFDPDICSLASGDLLSIGLDPTNARTASEVAAISIEIEEEIEYAA